MKKIAILLALIFAVSSLTFALANEEPEVYFSSDFAYILLEDGTAQITGYAGEAEALEIPSSIDGYAVTAIGDEAFSYNYALRAITIPDSITTIGLNPFWGCEKLTEISVSPDHSTLAVIDGVLFNKAENTLICYPYAFTADSYAIPQGTLTIGDCAFAGCTVLSEITIPDSVTTIGNMAFASCYALCEANIPEGVTHIGDRAFTGCESLNKVTIPESMTSISNGLFFYCSALEEITIPESITAIGDLAFEQCRGLRGITIPDSVLDMGDNPFLACVELSEINVSPDHPVLAVIDGVLFDKTENRLICYPRYLTAESYEIPQGVLTIGGFAFDRSPTLSAVTIPGSVTTIGDYAFSDCYELRGLVLPESIITIGNEAFAMCPGLNEVIIPENVTTIGEWAFSNCETLNKITVPGSVTAIGHGAFAYCAEDLTLTVEQDSFAAEYATENDIPCVYPN